MQAGDRFTPAAARWHGVRVTELRVLRQSLALSQQEFASLMMVPLHTFRMWDSGLRVPTSAAMARARAVVDDHELQYELISLDALAAEFGMHQRTLSDAVRAGRLEVQFSTRSAFGRPIRLATRAAVLAYRQQYYRRSYSRTMVKPPRPDRPILPDDYAEQITIARHSLRLTLTELATRIGAANKAVVYQWESGKRRPSPVFWAAHHETSRRESLVSATASSTVVSRPERVAGTYDPRSNNS